MVSNKKLCYITVPTVQLCSSMEEKSNQTSPSDGKYQTCFLSADRLIYLLSPNFDKMGISLSNRDSLLEKGSTKGNRFLKQQQKIVLGGFFGLVCFRCG